MATENLATQKDSTEGIGIRYGIYASVAMIIYFIVLNLLKLAYIEELRFMSHIFILIAVVLAIGAYKSKRPASADLPYLPGLSLGFVVGLSAAVIYAAFIFIYANFINVSFLQELQDQDYYGAKLSPFMLFAAIVILGIAVGSMTSYILMMLYDKSGGPEER
jgi:Protein of unknown function (DUF4199)